MHHTRLMAVMIGACTVAAARADAGDCILYDNGDANESNGLSNATVGVFGARRTLLDDFEVPENAVWTIEGLRHLHIWDTLPAGSGTGMEIALRVGDAAGFPSEVIIPSFEITGYEEVASGRIMFDREEAVSWTTFTPIELQPGLYWIEATIVGPENNFWLTREYPPHRMAAWINYEDFGGLMAQPGFGLHHDLAWSFCGTTTACVGDVNLDGAVGFPDLLEILRSWGADGGAADVTNDGDVDVDDVLRLLTVWGPCPSD